MSGARSGGRVIPNLAAVMPYELLTDIVIAIHAVFILFVGMGGFLVWQWRWLRWIHVPAVAWAVLTELSGWTCPLTPLEFWLRNQAGLEGYSTGYIEYYLWPLIYPDVLTRDHQIALGFLVLTGNLAIYIWLWRSHQRGQ